MSLCAVATGFSLHIGTPQSFIFMCLSAPPAHQEVRDFGVRRVRADQICPVLSQLASSF
jgi:hypothetical protein